MYTIAFIAAIWKLRKWWKKFTLERIRHEEAQKEIEKKQKANETLLLLPTSPSKKVNIRSRETLDEIRSTNTPLLLATSDEDIDTETSQPSFTALKE